MTRHIMSSFLPPQDADELLIDDLVHVGFLCKDKNPTAEDFREIFKGLAIRDGSSPFAGQLGAVRVFDVLAGSVGSKLYFCSLIVPGHAIEAIRATPLPENMKLSGFRRVESIYTDFMSEDFLPAGFSSAEPRETRMQRLVKRVKAFIPNF